MRLRNIKGARENIEASEFCVVEPSNYKGKWKEVFKNDNPIHIEVGMGKGRFVTTLASNNPDINYIGIEKYSSVLLRALEKQTEIRLPNLMFIRMDAEEICDAFEKDEIKKIYLNFSDPWPKDRHAKRRLTSKEFFKRYESILIKEGLVEFKTDNKMLFDFSLEQVVEANWDLILHTFDLHNSEYVTGNVMTEYEEKFSGMGHPINKLVAKQKTKPSV